MPYNESGEAMGSERKSGEGSKRGAAVDLKAAANKRDQPVEKSKVLGGDFLKRLIPPLFFWDLREREQKRWALRQVACTSSRGDGEGKRGGREGPVG